VTGVFFILVGHGFTETFGPCHPFLPSQFQFK